MIKKGGLAMFVKMSYPLYEEAPIGFFTTVKTRIIPTLRIANGDASNNEEVHLLLITGILWMLLGISTLRGSK